MDMQNHSTNKILDPQPVAAGAKGVGLPYAPENWPHLGDNWTWRVGNRKTAGGYWIDRYICPPSYFPKVSGGKARFQSRLSLEQYIRKEFPDSDVDAFFASFSWRILADCTRTDDDIREKKIIWTDKLTERFIKVCASQVKEGNRPTTYLNKKGWAKVQEELKFDLKQLKNKWDNLKKEWQLWKRLLGKETCLGWNSEKKTIEASDDWWEMKIKEVPGVAKFREKGLPLPNDIDLVFGDVVATGAHAWTPSSGVLPDQPELDMYLERSGDSEEDPPEAPIVEASSQCSEVAQKGKGKRVQQSSSKKQERKRQSVGTSVQYSLKRLSDVVEVMSKHTEVKECVKVLQALGLKNDMTFYTKCLCLLAEKKDARRFLLCLDDKESQLSFITKMVENWKK